MPDRSRKRPRDPNQLGKLIVDLSTGEADETPINERKKDRAAVEPDLEEETPTEG